MLVYRWTNIDCCAWVLYSATSVQDATDEQQALLKKNQKKTTTNKT